MGDLLRDEAKSKDSPYKDLIPESIQKSILLPAQLTTQLLKRAMAGAKAGGGRRFLLDGFPRSVDQAKDFELKVCFHCSDRDELIDQNNEDLRSICHDLSRLFGGRDAESTAKASGIVW